MSLTDVQKSKIRYMTSCNPTIENMSRIASLSDEEVLIEVDNFVTTRLPLLRQEKAAIEQEIQDCTVRLNTLNELIDLLN